MVQQDVDVHLELFSRRIPLRPRAQRHAEYGVGAAERVVAAPATVPVVRPCRRGPR